MPIPPDIAPDTIASRLTGRTIGRHLEVVADISSTNDAAMAAGHAGAPEGLAIVADKQTSGRGRLRRSWTSVPGLGVYTSILLRPQAAPLRAPLLTLMAGLATAEAVEAVGPASPALKWPNDVLCGGRFQTAYENGSIRYLTNGTVNGQRAICTARQEGGSCQDLLLTLRPEDNAMAVLRQLNDVLKGRAGATLRQSGPTRKSCVPSTRSLAATQTLAFLRM